MTTKPNIASRIALLDGVLNARPPAEARALLPEMWNERAALLRQQAELDRLEAKNAVEKEARERAAAFGPKIEEFRKRATDTARPLNVEVEALRDALAGMRELQADYNALWAQGTAAGASVPTLAELSGVGDRRLQRVEFSINLLGMGDQ